MLPSAAPARCLLLLLLLAVAVAGAAFDLEEATVDSIRRAFADGELTSRGLVELYLSRAAALDPSLHAVVELDPDGALAAADRADDARRLFASAGGGALPPPLLNGIPVLVKDNIAAAGGGGALNATCGSLALVGSRPAGDAGVVERLRRAGAVVLGTASLSEWCNFRAPGIPAGWSPRAGQGKVASSHGFLPQQAISNGELELTLNNLTESEILNAMCCNWGCCCRIPMCHRRRRARRAVARRLQRRRTWWR
jgi:hypothetical protein